MKIEQIVTKLNWFYSLELNQVDLYMAQSKQMDDIYLSKVLERAAYVEQQHVDNIAAKIRKLGSEPTKLGDTIAPLIGKLGGNISSKAGLVMMLKANIRLEQKAMNDYKNFILKVGDDTELFNLLWANLIDEDFHASWFASKAHELEQKH